MKRYAILTAVLAFFSTVSVLHAQNFSNPGISVGVVVTDLQASTDFYTDIIGMVETGGFSIDEDLGKRTGLTGGMPFDVTVLQLKDDPSAPQWKLMTFNRPPNHPGQKFIQDDTGMQYITLFVDDTAPVLSQIKKNNIPLLGDTPIKLGDGRTFILVQDPDGIFVEVIGDK